MEKSDSSRKVVVETKTRKEEIDPCELVVGQSGIGFGGYGS